MIKWLGGTAGNGRIEVYAVSLVSREDIQPEKRTGTVPINRQHPFSPSVQSGCERQSHRDP